MIDGGEETRLLGSSPPIRWLRARIEEVAPLDSTVLLLGETGSGKGVAARRLHARSRRRAAAFVHVDCAALAPALAESELFGHERGAFTGAVRGHAGRFERAGAGTLLLDEIGELTPPLQAKLLRVLEDRAFERVGGDRTLPMRARVVAATRVDLPAAVRSGRFRADLFFRLDVVRLRVPSLRERPEDVPLLVADGLEAVARRLGVAPPRLAPEQIARLRSHDWPGNVRELRNVLEQLAVRSAGGAVADAVLAQILEASRGLVPGPPAPAAGADLARVLAAAGGNVTRAARRLGIPRGTLRWRLARLGIAPRPGR